MMCLFLSPLAMKDLTLACSVLQLKKMFEFTVRKKKTKIR